MAGEGRGSDFYAVGEHGVAGHTLDSRLGIQLWLEEDDTPVRVEHLVEQAAAAGFGQLRIFLMWPWIQRESVQEWRFDLFDSVFDAAARVGAKIKATLTANSGPWWLATPSVLHSHTLTLRENWVAPAQQYVEKCVTRYVEHPALGQWILWNEPSYPFTPLTSPSVRPEKSGRAWAHLLRDRYGNDIKRLNRRWRAGYAAFDEVPFPENIAHPAHRDSSWQSFAPIIDEFHLRATLLEEEIVALARSVRRFDPGTPLCVNPSRLLENHAASGYRLSTLGAAVDVMGASFHAPHHFGFAPREDHPAIVVAGVSMLRSISESQRTEVTEIQTGNTYYTGVDPVGVTYTDIGWSYLAPLLAGAESVTGWCFNTRQQDHEAGEWGLLDDEDAPSERLVAVSAVRDTLRRLDEAIGPWQARQPSAAVLFSEDAQAIELAIAETGKSGRRAVTHSAMRAGALLVAELNQLGLSAALAQPCILSRPTVPSLIIVSGFIAFDAEFGGRLLEAAENGATIVIDGMAGQFDFDARLNRPWPPGLWQGAGLRSRGIRTSPTGQQSDKVLLHGHTFSELEAARSDVEISSDAWRANADLCWRDGHPVFFEREYGIGRLIYCTAGLSNSLAEGGARAAVGYILSHAASGVRRGCRAVSPSTVLLEVQGERGVGYGAFASPYGRDGECIALQLPPGRYQDLWSGGYRYVSNGDIMYFDRNEQITILVPD